MQHCLKHNGHYMETEHHAARCKTARLVRLFSRVIPHLLQQSRAAKRRSHTGQPAAMAGEALRVIMDMGKFQGVTAYTTPTGSLITTNFLSADGGCSRISTPCQAAPICI